MNKQKKTNLFITITVIIIVSSIGYFPKKKSTPLKVEKDSAAISKAFKCKNWK